MTPVSAKREIGLRLKRVREAMNVQQKEMCDILGIHQNTLSQYERGINGISNTMLTKFVQVLKINIHWLVNGEGEMFLSKAAEKSDVAVEPEIAQVVSNRGEKSKSNIKHEIMMLVGECDDLEHLVKIWYQLKLLELDRERERKLGG